MGIYITLEAQEPEDSISNLLDSFILFKNRLIKEKLFEPESLTIWENGPNIAYGERLERINDYEQFEVDLSSVRNLNKLLMKHNLSKGSDKRLYKNHKIEKFVGKNEPFNFHIIGLKPFAIQLDGKLLLSNNHIPGYIKVLLNTGFEHEYGNIYLDTFSHFGKDFMDFLLNNPIDFKNIIKLMKEISQTLTIHPLKIVIGEDQVNNLYSIGSVFFWYKNIQKYFVDIDSFIKSINEVGESEKTYFLDQLGITNLFYSKILENFKEFGRIYKLENLRDSYSKAKEMENFLMKVADKVSIPVSMKHSFMAYSEDCNPKKTALYGEKVIVAIHEILSKTLQRENKIKKKIEDTTNLVLGNYKI